MTYRSPPPNALLFVSFGAVVHALDPSNGKVVWTNDDCGDAAGGAMIFRGERLYLAGWRTAHCIDAASGKTLWSRPIAVKGRLGLMICGDRLYAGALGVVSCLSLDGTVLWENEFAGEGTGNLAMAIADQHARDDRDT